MLNNAGEEEEAEEVEEAEEQGAECEEGDAEDGECCAYLVHVQVKLLLHFLRSGTISRVAATGCVIPAAISAGCKGSRAHSVLQCVLSNPIKCLFGFVTITSITAPHALQSNLVLCNLTCSFVQEQAP